VRSAHFEQAQEMARNRKYLSAAVRFGPALRAFLLCLVIGGSGVGYVWQKDQISRLSQQIKQRELKLLALEDLNEKQKKTLAMMRSPAKLEARIKELNLGLGPPQISQIWQLTEPARQGAKTGRENQFAVQEGRR
jgi:uncharacterized protein HemX